MFDFFYDWIKNIAFFTVMMTAVLHVVPNPDYRKYLRFFMGIIMVILLLAPLRNLITAGKEIESLYESSTYRQQVEQIEKASSFWEEIDVYNDTEEELRRE